MVKYKIEYNAGQKFLVIQGQKGQQISQREYYAISNGQIPGLLRAQLINKGNAFRLNYNISGYISLREFLVNPLNKQSFARLLGNILNNLKALQNAYYNHQFILMDMDAAMVNPTTQQVSFVYVPITFYESGTNLKEFLLSIIQRCSFVPGENTEYVRDYIRILNSGINFSIFDLEEYIKTLNVNNTQNTVKKCTHCGSPLPPNVNFCSACGMKISGLNMANPQGVYDPSKSVVMPPKIVNNDFESAPTTVHSRGNTGYTTQHGVNGVVNVPPQAPQAEVNEQPQVSQVYMGTISSSCIEDDIKNQSIAPVNQTMHAGIRRLKTDELIQVSASSFRIGKDPFNCEYCVRDNPAISRCHASIKQINNKWFITDLNSTNKTYVNGQMLQPNFDFEIQNGMKLKLANEEFVFILY